VAIDVSLGGVELGLCYAVGSNSVRHGLGIMASPLQSGQMLLYLFRFGVLLDAGCGWSA
jgi:hypothetical protein